MDLPLFKLVINDNDESGVTGIALVDSPAIGQSWQAFSADNKLKKITLSLGFDKGNFQPVEGAKQILRGPLMIPDIQIYRISSDGQEYNVKFDTQTIQQIQKKFSRLLMNDKINQMHDENKPVSDSYLFQHFIIDRAAGIMPPKGFEKLSDGTWFGDVFVGDKSVFDEFVLTGIYTGFSVEGYFHEEPVSTALAQEDIDFILSLL